VSSGQWVAGKMRTLHTPPRVFWQESLDLLDCKGVDFFRDDQEISFHLHGFDNNRGCSEARNSKWAWLSQFLLIFSPCMLLPQKVRKHQG